VLIWSLLAAHAAPEPAFADFDCCRATSERAREPVRILVVPLADGRPDAAGSDGLALDDDTPLPRPIAAFATDALVAQLRAAGHRVRVAETGPAPGEPAVDWADLVQTARDAQVTRVVHGSVARWDSIDGGATLDLLAVGPHSEVPWVGSVATTPSDPTGAPGTRFRRGLQGVATSLTAPGSTTHDFFVNGTLDARSVVERAAPVPVAGLPASVEAPDVAPEVPVVTLDDIPVAGLPEETAGLPPVAPPVEPGGVPQGVGQPGLPPPPPPIPTVGMPAPAPSVLVVTPEP
jgi:hypothetical protein